MKAFSTLNILTMAVITAVLISLSSTVNVVADDEAPLPPTEEAVSLTEETPPVENVEDEQPSSEVVEPVNDLPKLIENLPEGTKIVVVSSEGIEPLVTMAAANLLAVGDPIWCPAGSVPIPNSGGCSNSFTSLASLVYTIADPGATGVIWITEGTDTSASFISLDGSAFTNWGDYNLTIQGGWNGDALGTITSSTTFGQSIEIVNWLGNISVNNITINSTGSTALSITTDGNVTLNNLSFSGNDDSGLYVSSGGEIIGENITSENNGVGGTAGYGAEFVADALTLNGNNTFSGNVETGIYATINGDISISNLVADNNGSSGYGAGAELISSNGGITLTGTNQFDANNNTGIFFDAAGVVSVENIASNGNGAGNSYGYGTEVLASEFELLGANEFNDNFDSGISAVVTDDITIANISANNNGTGGFGYGAELVANTGNVDVSGINEFNGNNASGLFIEAGGTISAENVTANGNGTGGYGYGAEIEGAELTITGLNQFNENHESGMYADISGDVSISNMIATENGQNGGYGVGAEIISAGSVTFLGNNIFSLNSSGGLSVEADADISIFNTEVNDNLDTGMYLVASDNIVVDCSEVIGNSGYGIDSSSLNLFLYGTQVTGNSSDDVITDDPVIYISNSCFVYTLSPYPEVEPVSPSTLNLPGQPVNFILIESGENAGLNCGLYRGTTLVLPNGDGAYLPCGFGNEARLILLDSRAIPSFLPRGSSFVSSFNLVVLEDGQDIPSLGGEGSIWYWYIGEDDEGRQFTRILFWDGENWIETNQNNLPFVRVFFLVPEEMKGSNLAILFWDGANWVELADSANFGDGRFVKTGGNFDGTFFEAEVNFVGTFVLVEK